jgi:hypothetical protein
MEVEPSKIINYVNISMLSYQNLKARTKWEDARAIVNLIITASLIHDATHETWDTEGEDPKVTYETVLRAFQRHLKMLSVPLLHLETRNGLENARKGPLSR